MRYLRYVLGASVILSVVWAEPRSRANLTAQQATIAVPFSGAPRENVAKTPRASDMVLRLDTPADDALTGARVDALKPFPEQEKSSPADLSDASLDVPYLNQNIVTPLRIVASKPSTTPISHVACGCTSVAMLFAHAKKVPAGQTAMIAAVHDCFRFTSMPRVGVYGPEPLVRYLKKRGFTGSGFLPFTSADQFIFTVLTTALKQGMPQLLSVRAPSASGHYLVVTGIEGNDPETARIVVNDPYGRWEACRRVGVPETEKCYNDPNGDGKDVRYNFAEVTRAGGRLYVIR